MSSLPVPKASHAIVKVSRWTMLSLGLVYGFQRNKVLGNRETGRRAKEEEERPAREAALKVEKDRKYKEEMDYLARAAGIITVGSGDGKVATDFKLQ